MWQVMLVRIYSIFFFCHNSCSIRYNRMSDPLAEGRIKRKIMENMGGQTALSRKSTIFLRKSVFQADMWYIRRIWMRHALRTFTITWSSKSDTVCRFYSEKSKTLTFTTGKVEFWLKNEKIPNFAIGEPQVPKKSPNERIWVPNMTHLEKSRYPIWFRRKPGFQRKLWYLVFFLIDFRNYT